MELSKKKFSPNWEGFDGGPKLHRTRKRLRASRPVGHCFCNVGPFFRWFVARADGMEKAQKADAIPSEINRSDRDRAEVHH